MKKLSRYSSQKSPAGRLLTAGVTCYSLSQLLAFGHTNAPTQLQEIVVQGRDDSLVGIADSAAQGIIGARQLELRTLTKPSEVLETVPGMIITQHSGGGKASQYFLRGFNLDHGTDFATSVNGIPVNMPTHGHGQGWTDLNFLIPELVYTLNYKKGPYYADEGDFASAGAANIDYFTKLPKSIAHLEAGSFGYGRALVAMSPELGTGNLLYALEAFHNDGPWTNPDDYQKFNGVVGWSQGDKSQGYSVTLMGYHGDWNSTDQIASRAVMPGFGRFDTLNPSDGGKTQRYSLSGEWHRNDDHSSSKIMVYGMYYDMNLWSDFTYFSGSPMGDQFEQMDKRWVLGTKASHTWFHHLADRDMETTVGLQVRNDNINNGLFQTIDQVRTPKVDYTGAPIAATTREDDVWENSVGVYAENKAQWAEKFRTTIGIRGDFYNFDVDSDNPLNSGTESDFIASPKLGLIFGPWADTEVYLNGGLGFHSNDGRGVTSRVDPTDPTQTVTPADPLVQTYGAEIGVRTTIIPNLHSSVSLWWLDIDSELLFVGDAGSTDATRPSRRYGIEFANYYTPTDWLTLDLDYSLSHSRFRDDALDSVTGAPIGTRIPGSIENVVAAGITFHDLHGFFGGLRLRYFGPRPLIEDDTVRSGETVLLSAQVGYKFNETWTLSAEVFNILDRKDSEIDYYYDSRLAGEPGDVTDIHYHPVDPISFRVALTAKF